MLDRLTVKFSYGHWGGSKQLQMYLHTIGFGDYEAFFCVFHHFLKGVSALSPNCRSFTCICYHLEIGVRFGMAQSYDTLHFRYGLPQPMLCKLTVVQVYWHYLHFNGTDAYLKAGHLGSPVTCLLSSLLTRIKHFGVF